MFSRLLRAFPFTLALAGFVLAAPADAHDWRWQRHHAYYGGPVHHEVVYHRPYFWGGPRFWAHC